MANQSAKKTRSARRFFQFRLVTLLVLMVAVGFASMRIAALLDDRPIEWKTYSKESLEECLNDGETVMILWNADWSLLSSLFEARADQNRQVCQLIRYRGVVAMKADITSNNLEAREALWAIGKDTVGTIAIYNASSPSDPVVFNTDIKMTELYDALENYSR